MAPTSDRIIANAMKLLSQAEVLAASDLHPTELHLAITAEEEMAKAFLVYLTTQGFKLDKFNLKKKLSHKLKHELISELYMALSIAECELDYALAFTSDSDESKLTKLREMTLLRYRKAADFRDGIYIDYNRETKPIPPSLISEYLKDTREMLDKLAVVMKTPLHPIAKRALSNVIILQKSVAGPEILRLSPMQSDSNPGIELFRKTNFWSFTMWLMIFQFLSEMHFEGDWNDFQKLYGEDPTNIKKFILGRMLMKASQKCGIQTVRSMTQQREYRSYIQLLFAMELALLPLLQGGEEDPENVPIERETFSELELRNLPQEEQSGLDAANLGKVKETAHILGLDDIVLQYEAMNELIRATLENRESPNEEDASMASERS